MITQIVYLTADENHLEAFLAEIQANARESLKETGILQFDVLRETGNSLRFVLYEVYVDLEALESHRLTQHFKRWQEFGVPLLNGPRERVLYDTVNV